MKYGKNGFCIPGILLVLGLMLTSGCGDKKSEEKKAEMATEAIMKAATGKDVDVDIQDGNVEIKDKDSTTQMKKTSEWPADMFSDVPRFPSGRIERVNKTSEATGRRAFNIHMADIDMSVVNQYADLLKAEGWQANVTLLGDKGAMLSGQKNNLGMSFPFNSEKKNGVLMVFGTR